MTIHIHGGIPRCHQCDRWSAGEDFIIDGSFVFCSWNCHKHHTTKELVKSLNWYTDSGFLPCNEGKLLVSKLARALDGLKSLREKSCPECGMGLQNGYYPKPEDYRCPKGHIVNENSETPAPQSPSMESHRATD